MRRTIMRAAALAAMAGHQLVQVENERDEPCGPEPVCFDDACSKPNRISQKKRRQRAKWSK